MLSQLIPSLSIASFQLALCLTPHFVSRLKVTLLFRSTTCPALNAFDLPYPSTLSLNTVILPVITRLSSNRVPFALVKTFIYVI
jgi:hypothetical protein